MNGLRTADDLSVELCTVSGAEHDYRAKTYDAYPGHQRTSLVCLWCSAVACGDYGEADPCIEPYHHAGGHRTAAGVRWPKGDDRP